jgi:hypothetical protein
VDPGAGLDDFEKRKFFTLPRLENRTFGRPSRSQSLYRLSYPCSLHYIAMNINNLLTYDAVNADR